MQIKHICAASAFAFSLSTNVLAGDAENGRVLAETCMGCHGVDGLKNAYPAYKVPRLGGQHADYMVAALKLYRSGDRDHATMQAQASSLSDAEIADIAAYFASQKPE